MKKKFREKLGLTVYYALKIIIVVGLVYAIYDKQWDNAMWIAGIFILSLIPTLLKKRYQLYFPLEFDVLIISFIFLALFMGEIFDYYQKIWWWDLSLHGGSGFLLGIFGFLLVYILNQHKNIQIHMRAGFVSIFAFAFAMAIGVLWEIFEFTIDSTFGLNMQKSGLQDTMGDLIVNSMGALIISILGYLWMKKKIKSFVFDKSIKRFVKENVHLFKGR